MFGGGAELKAKLAQMKDAHHHKWPNGWLVALVDEGFGRKRAFSEQLHDYLFVYGKCGTQRGGTGKILNILIAFANAFQVLLYFCCCCPFNRFECLFLFISCFC